ncbi:MAG: small multi-drug export protein, partial [Patescibacteria group bacterium]
MIPGWLQVIALSIAPITEYQLAIPLALTTYHYPWYFAYALGVFGSFLPFFPLFFGFEFVRRHVTRLFPRLIRPFDMLIARAEKKVRGDYDKYGAIALFIALVIPFPLTGVWTTTLA